MKMFSLPYGKTHLAFDLPAGAERIAPAEAEAAPDALAAVREALAHPVGENSLHDWRGVESVAIAINDKTRPVPHAQLLPPLLDTLAEMGIAAEKITFVIATGTHPPMTPDEFPAILPPDIIGRYRVVSHDAEDKNNLVDLGQTPRGTPILMNRDYMAADLRLVVGNIEPHQFMGFSGGVKSAAVGLAGKATINRNHALMTEPLAQLGVYEGNPARADVEDIGRIMGVHYALNAILNERKQIVRALAGDPVAVMQAGIPLVRSLYQVAVAAPYDVVIASPGGHPKDINLYQAQKALAHARLITRPGGRILLVAACPEGTGSTSYENWLAEGAESHQAVIARFIREGYRVGPHKAYQISRDAVDVRVLLLSEMPPDFVRKLLLEPVSHLDEGLQQVLSGLPTNARIGVMPLANATVPMLAGA